jgi:hypothetical protein
MRDSMPDYAWEKQGAEQREAQYCGDDHPHQRQITEPASHWENLVGSYVSAWHDNGKA